MENYRKHASSSECFPNFSKFLNRFQLNLPRVVNQEWSTWRQNITVAVTITTLHTSEAAVQCIVIGTVCGFACVFVGHLGLLP